MQAFKSANGYIITLEIPPHAKTNLDRENVVDRDYAYFRCDEAKVMKIEHKETKKAVELVSSDRNWSFVYRLGETIKDDDYDDNKNKVYTSGIHFFLTEEAAYYYDFKTKNGLSLSWYDNGQIHEKGEFCNGKREGEWMQWYEKGQIREKGNYHEGKLEGNWTSWYPNDQIRELGKYQMGEREGEWMNWYQNGEFREIREFLVHF